MTGLEIGLLAGSVGSSIGNLASQIWTNKKTWRREDMSVQRRMKDLMAAGLNPNLAAGSAASSSVVNAPRMEINPGQMIDAATAVEQIKQQREATKAAKSYADMMASQANQAKLDYSRDMFNTLYNYGFDVFPRWEHGGLAPYFNSHWENNTLVTNFGSNFGTSPFMRALGASLQSQEYQRDLLGKQNVWYNTNQVMNQIWNGVDALTDLGRTGSGIYDMFKPESITKSRVYGHKGYTETQTRRR